MELKTKIRRSSDINGILLIAFEVLVLGGVQLLLAPVTSLFAEEGSDSYETVYSLIAFIMQYFIGVGIPLLIFYRTSSGKELGEKTPLFAKPQMSWGWIIKFIFISFFFIYSVNYFFNFLTTMIQRLLDVEFSAVDFYADETFLSRLTNVIAMMFLAPFFEELLFRGTFVRNSARYGGWHAIIAVGIVFGLWHMNYAQTFATAAFGICAGFLFVKTRSIIPSMILHFCFNTIGAFQSMIVDADFAEKVKSGKTLEIMTDDPNRYILVSLTGMFIIGLMITGVILFSMECSKHPESFKLERQSEDNGELSEPKKLGIYFSAPATLFVSVALLVLTVLRGAGLF